MALAGRRVLLLEAGGELGQAWKAAAGMLAPQIEAGPEDPLLELGLEARELYRTLGAELLETTGIDVGLWQEGIAAVAATEAEATELLARCAWPRQQGHPGDWLDAAGGGRGGAGAAPVGGGGGGARVPGPLSWFVFWWGLFPPPYAGPLEPARLVE